MKFNKKNNDVSKKYWHCLYCGKNQDASNTKCENCGKDLIMNGKMVSETNDTANSTTNNSVKDNSKKSPQKLLIAICAVLGVVVIAFICILLIPERPTSTETTTSSQETTASSAETTTLPAQKSDDTVFPDFLEFANGYASVETKENKEYLTKITYEVNVSDASVIMEEYVDLLLRDYAFKELYKDARKSFHGFEYTGTENLDTFYLTFSTGEADEEKYTDLNFSINNYNENNTEYIIICYSSPLTVESTTERTSYNNTQVSSLSIPDFEIFANGNATETKSVTNSNNNLIHVYFEIKDETVINQYIELLEQNYNFEMIYDNKLYNWKGFKYTGTEKSDTFSTVLKDIDGNQVNYENINLSIYVYDDPDTGKRTAKFMYSRTLKVVTPTNIN